MLIDAYINLFGRQLPAFTVLVLLATFISAGVVILRTPSDTRAKIADVILAAIIGGVITARGVHVALHWQYFSERTQDITRLESGGLSWVGAGVGALLAGFIVSRLRNVDYSTVLARIPFVVPFIGMAAWTGCSVNFCAYGAEVADMSDYPAFLTHESPDVFGNLAPRFHTQLLGFALCFILLLLALYLQRTEKLPRWRFWLIVCLFTFGMVGISFLQAT